MTENHNAVLTNVRNVTKEDANKNTKENHFGIE